MSFTILFSNKSPGRSGNHVWDKSDRILPKLLSVFLDEHERLTYQHFVSNLQQSSTSDFLILVPLNRL